MRWPVFSAIVPEVVSREHLGAAMALNGISMNLSRVVGPVVAGAILAAVGSGAVFVLNFVLAATAFVTILRWKSTPKASTLPGERFVGAMRVGLAARDAVAAAACGAAAHLLLLPAFVGAAGAAAAGGAAHPRCRAGHLHGDAGLHRRRRGRRGDVLPALACAFQPQPVRAHRHRGARGDVGDRGLRAQHLGGAAGHRGVRHGLDFHRQFADPGRADGLARLGARARHVDLPDGADGRCGHRLAAVGPCGRPVQRQHRGHGGGRGRARPCGC